MTLTLECHVDVKMCVYMSVCVVFKCVYVNFDGVLWSFLGIQKYVQFEFSHSHRIRSKRKRENKFMKSILRSLFHSRSGVIFVFFSISRQIDCPNDNDSYGRRDRNAHTMTFFWFLYTDLWKRVIFVYSRKLESMHNPFHILNLSRRKNTL